MEEAGNSSYHFLACNLTSLNNGTSLGANGGLRNSKISSPFLENQMPGIILYLLLYTSLASNQYFSLYMSHYSLQICQANEYNPHVRGP